jgi:hypothetical protein
MMRTSLFRPLLVLSLSALTAAAGAQTPPPSTPPKLERLEEVPDAPITVTPKSESEKSVTEKREQGRVTEIKVKSGKSTYYLKPNNPTGTVMPGDAMSGTATRGAQWRVTEFDIGGKKKKTKEEEAADNAPPPPAPPAAK